MQSDNSVFYVYILLFFIVILIKHKYKNKMTEEGQPTVHLGKMNLSTYARLQMINIEHSV